MTLVLQVTPSQDIEMKLELLLLWTNIPFIKNDAFYILTKKNKSDRDINCDLISFEIQTVLLINLMPS